LHLLSASTGLQGPGILLILGTRKPFKLTRIMKNTTKLRHILKLYTVSLDMDDEDQFYLTLVGKNKGGSATFVNKSYTSVMSKAFSHLMKELKTHH
jgi:hypothetical protein